jgi:hypothetical protein
VISILPFPARFNDDIRPPTDVVGDRHPEKIGPAVFVDLTDVASDGPGADQVCVVLFCVGSDPLHDRLGEIAMQSSNYLFGQFAALLTAEDVLLRI